MNYVKTYEIFGLSKKEKLLKSEKERELLKKSEAEKEEKEALLEIKSKETYYNLVKNYLINYKSSLVHNISCQETDDSKISVSIHLNKLVLDKSSLPIESGYIDFVLYVGFQSKEIFIHESSNQHLVLNSKDIINSKGDFSEDIKTFRVPLYRSGGIRKASYGGPRKIIESNVYNLSFTEEDKTTLSTFIEEKCNTIAYWIRNYIGIKISKFKRKDELESFNSIEENEILEILSDILDLSNGNYKVKKHEDHYIVIVNIPGVLNSKDHGMKFNKETTQVIRYIPEIKDRLNDIGLEMSINFLSEKEGIVIKINGI